MMLRTCDRLGSSGDQMLQHAAQSSGRSRVRAARVSLGPVRGAAILLAVWWLPGLAAAQGSTGELTARQTDHHLAATLSLFDDSGGFTPDGMGFTHVTLLATWLRGAMTLHRDDDLVVGLDVDAAVLLTVYGGTPAPFPGLPAVEPHLGMSIGNVLVGPHVAWERHDTSQSNRIRGGIGVTVPLSQALNDDPRRRGWFAGQHGVWDYWLTERQWLALVLRGDAEHVEQFFLVGAEAAFGALLPIERGESYSLQAAGWIAGRPIPELALGVRLQGVVAANPEWIDGFVGLTPFVRVESGAGIAEVRLFMNLDEPFGFAFEDTGYSMVRFWSLDLRGGARF